MDGSKLAKMKFECGDVSRSNFFSLFKSPSLEVKWAPNDYRMYMKAICDEILWSGSQISVKGLVTEFRT